MLVVSRKTDEKVRIGADITITVGEIKGDRVRLCVDAPRNVPVFRYEVWVKIQKENHADDKPPATNSDADTKPCG